MQSANFVPYPFCVESFEVLRHGIFDDEHISVFINQQRDFAYLSPQPHVDYAQYTPRVTKLGLSQYKAKLDTYHRRVRKVSRYLEQTNTIVDIGTGDGLFLKIVKDQYPHITVAACEQDQNTLEERRKIVGSETFDTLDELVATERKFSVVTFFHVLEHILKPAQFLGKIRQLLSSKSIVIIEVPSLSCPLLTLYHSEAYQAFYFQKQHPFNYSHASLQRLMESFKFHTVEVLNFQRYGLENHLQWLTDKKPGGNQVFRDMFARTNEQYLADLERVGMTDSAIWVGKGPTIKN